jgi:hypothetical protein
MSACADWLKGKANVAKSRLMTIRDLSFLMCGVPQIPPLLSILVKPFIGLSLLLQIGVGMNKPAGQA